MAENERRSLASDLFSRITSDPIKVIRSMVEGEEKATEKEWLEFKSYPEGYYKNPALGYGPKNLADPKKDFVKSVL